MYDWDFSWVWSYRGELAEALWVTVYLNLAILSIGTVAGVIVGLLSQSGKRLVRLLITIYVDLFRTLPVLVLLVWFFYCIPILLGGVRISATWSAIIVLALNLSAFLAEIVRAGLQAVPQNFIDDAVATRMTKWQIQRYILLPIALRIMIPPSVGQYINTIKLSVLASIIAVPELLNRTTDIISQVYRPLEFYTVLAVIFLVLLLPGTILSRKLEQQQERKGRASGRSV